MKIAILSQTYPPMVSGAAIVAHGLAEQMAQRGHRVLVLTSSDRRAPYREVKSNLIIYRLRSIRNPMRVNQRSTLWPHRQIMSALTEFAPQVIHTHDPLQYAWSALLYGQQTGTPTILTVHLLPWNTSNYLPNNTIQRGVNRSLWAYSRRLISHFYTVVTPTQTIADIVKAQTGLAPRVISFGVDPDIFHPGPLSTEQESAWRLRLGIVDQRPILLTVGRLDKDKHVDRVIQAFVRADVQAHLLVVGDGTEKTSLIRLCQELEIATRCHFPGFITLQQGLPDVYRLASAFITASECETQGLVLLEAASCGLPIAAVEGTSIPEIVHPGVNGWLATPGDIDDLARCIQRLFANSLETQAMRQAGRQIAQELTLQKTITEYEGIYRQAARFSRSLSSYPEAIEPF